MIVLALWLDAVLDDGVIVLPLKYLLKPLFYFFLHAAFFLLCRFCSCSVKCVMNMPTERLSFAAICFSSLYVDTRTATDLNFIVSNVSSFCFFVSYTLSAVSASFTSAHNYPTFLTSSSGSLSIIFSGSPKSNVGCSGCFATSGQNFLPEL